MHIKINWSVCIHRLFPYYYDEDNSFYEQRLEMEQVFGELAFYKGSSYYLYETCFIDDQYNKEAQCPTGNYSQIANMVS
jgi:hypothetical protein